MVCTLLSYLGNSVTTRQCDIFCKLRGTTSQRNDVLLAQNEANNPNDNPHTFHVLRTYIFGEKKKGEKSHIFNKEKYPHMNTLAFNFDI